MGEQVNKKLVEVDWLADIKGTVADIEKIYYNKWKTEEVACLLDQLYGSGGVDWLIEQAERAELYEKALKDIAECKNILTVYDATNRAYEALEE